MLLAASTAGWCGAPRAVSSVAVQETDAVIRQRFGVHGLRLFRLLYLHPQLEQKQIAEQAMLPPKVRGTACSAEFLLLQTFTAKLLLMPTIIC